MKQKGIKIFTVLCCLAIIGCIGAKKSEPAPITDDELGVLKGSVFDESPQLPDGRYINTEPGESTLIERSFENAPPMIPHTVEDYFIITARNNECVACHLPENAFDAEATPTPKTHNIADDELDPKMYFCTLCHAPQEDVKPVIGNTFSPEFRDDKSKSSSNLYDIMNEGVE